MVPSIRAVHPKGSGSLLDDVHDFASFRLYQVCPVINHDIAIFHVRNVHRVEFDFLVESSNRCSTQLQAERSTPRASSYIFSHDSFLFGLNDDVLGRHKSGASKRENSRNCTDDGAHKSLLQQLRLLGLARRRAKSSLAATVFARFARCNR